jgi:membrane protease YdiL (CAAX protease family)
MTPRQRWASALAAVGAAAWTGLVGTRPSPFFLVAAAFCTVWLALSVAGAPPGLSARLSPRWSEVAIGVASGLLLFAASRAFLWAFCGGLTDVLRAPVAAIFERFESRTPLAGLALALFIVPGEEVFWRGVALGWLAPRRGAVWGVALTTLIPAALSLAVGEPLLALATLPAYGLWGALVAWRRSLVPALASHLTWSLLMAVLLPPV